jgi:hypothetical protein
MLSRLDCLLAASNTFIESAELAEETKPEKDGSLSLKVKSWRLVRDFIAYQSYPTRLWKLLKST